MHADQYNEYIPYFEIKFMYKRMNKEIDIMMCEVFYLEHMIRWIIYYSV